MGQRNMICHRNFLPYKMPPVSLRKSPIYYTSLLKKATSILFYVGFYDRLDSFAPLDTLLAS